MRNAGSLSFAEIEGASVDYVKKIRENRLALADLKDGAFTVSNGGVYGVLLGTPILNTPRSGIPGMHQKSFCHGLLSQMRFSVHIELREYRQCQ